jgi:hypothetical protein
MSAAGCTGVAIGVLTSHVGYKPGLQKTAIIPRPIAPGTRFRVHECGWSESWGRPRPAGFEGVLVSTESDWGQYQVADFTGLGEPGFYQVTVGGDEARSVPFLIGEDVYARTLQLAFAYFHRQRCGVAVPGYHSVCHLDDAVAREDGRPLDVSGGWHDAGDLRKWMTPPLLACYGLLELARRLSPRWNRLGSPWGDVLDEFRWENAYFLKMQDPETGRVWADTAGGIGGDNSDNRWTDNLPGSGDERHVNQSINPEVQWKFVAVEARAAQAFAALDGAYAGRCLHAAARCWQACGGEAPAGTVELAWACLAALEVSQLGWPEGREAAARFARELMARQAREYEYQQQRVRGYFYADAARHRLLKTWWQSGLPAIALARLLETEPAAEDAGQWREALRLYVDDCVLPLCDGTPFQIVPYGLYANPPVGEGRARRLAGDLCYRYFKWDEAASAEEAASRDETFQHGATSHLLNQAVALGMAARLLETPAARQLAYKQLEWVMGANPEAACLMTGGGLNSPFPHSRFVGLLVGGIMNGFVGEAADEPFLDMECRQDWRTTEYWCPHNGNYLWALAVLEQDSGIAV